VLWFELRQEHPERLQHNLPGECDNGRSTCLLNDFLFNDVTPTLAPYLSTLCEYTEC
jgi:hypothetical protein